MARYRIEVKESAIKELFRLPKKDLKKIIEKIDSLADNPRPAGCEKLTADEKYRIRYRHYRILYMIEEYIAMC